MSDVDFNALLILISEKIDVGKLPRLKRLCRGKISTASVDGINCVWDLLIELEKCRNLGPDNLNVLKDVLNNVTGGKQLLKDVKKFEDKRKEKKSGIVPSLKGVAGKIAGGIGSTTDVARKLARSVYVRCTFRNGAGVLVCVSGAMILYHAESLQDYMNFFSNYVLPAGNFLRELRENCLLFTVQAETLSALETLWKEYQDGTLQQRLQQFLVTEELKKVTGHEDLKVTGYISDQDYKHASLDLLISDAKESKTDHEEQPQERCRRKSDSDLCIKPVETDVAFMRLQQTESRLLLERERRQQLESEIKNQTAEEMDAENAGDAFFPLETVTLAKRGPGLVEYTPEQLNYFRISYIAFHLIPEGLRKIFKQEWDIRYRITCGEWTDSPQNGRDFYSMESPRFHLRHAKFLITMQKGDTAEWDVSCLYLAIMLTDSIGKTLSPIIRNCVDHLRLVRNSVAHLSEVSLTDAEFQSYVNDVLRAFTALGLPINDVEAVRNQREFRTPEVKALEKLVDDVTTELRRANAVIRSIKEEHAEMTQEVVSKVEPFCNLTSKPSHPIITRSRDVKRITQVMEEIHTGSQRTVSTIYLSGNPGCGKSQLARQIGQEMYRSRTYALDDRAFIGTINAKTIQTIGDSYIFLAKKLGIEENTLNILAIAMAERPKETINHLKKLISPVMRMSSVWLIIADNVVDLTMAHSCLPQTASKEWGHGQVLITTQDSSAIPTNSRDTYHESLSAGMQPDVAAELLRQVSQMPSQEHAMDVARVLDYQPLALASAALYAQAVVSGRSPKYSWLDYLELIRNIRHEMPAEEPLRTLETPIKVAINKVVETDEMLRQTYTLFLLCASDSLPIQAVVNFVENRTIESKEGIKEHLLRSSSFVCFSEDGAPEYLRLHSTVLQLLKAEAIFELESKESVKCLSTATAIFIELIAEMENASTKDEKVYVQLRIIKSHLMSMVTSMRTGMLTSTK